ncbi:hypothetical protein PUNSTDRAFT_122900 [Punctularia strigosozonata HHB-11173 SS5]|uniref:Pentacotripeptide-repeat region of PRORP domain-containing protein n=1 Tax=Punctularia strigosozonata (strain HHB-11173) TaxID=741275 RepID=R7S3A7_PUNST|nr:uncharacterized protein PUNSTDRAFT_122900 [Punctularia strigosozonata HHB-11173 SS5]EIN04339.1 hypothetical protein PUNSTDRAFT_122900 [Punctularia strigosozonata HHB-11173 SS5]
MLARCARTSIFGPALRSSVRGALDFPAACRRHVRTFPPYAFTKPVQEKERAEAIDHARVNTLLHSLTRSLDRDNSKPNPDAAYALFTSALPTFTSGLARRDAYERATNMFLIYGAYKHALALHYEMRNERHMPSPKLQALIVALKIAEDASYCASDDHMLAALQPVLALPNYTENALRHLLHFLCEVAPSGQLVNRILDAFIEARNKELKEKIPRRQRTRRNYEEYELHETTVCALVNIHSKLGTYDSAEALLEDADVASVFQAFLANLSDEIDTKQSSSNVEMPTQDPICGSGRLPPPYMSAEEVLARMASSGVPPDIVVFNILIAREVRRSQLEKAFAIFEMLLAAGLTPDGTTFASLFVALKKLERARIDMAEGRRRSARTRRVKVGEHMRTTHRSLNTEIGFGDQHSGSRLRALYHAMLYTHAKETTGRMAASSKIVTSSTLTVALRAFLAARDYAGAYVVIRTFAICRVDVPARAWLSVFKELSRRARLDIPQAQRQLAISARWGVGDEKGMTWILQFLGGAIQNWMGIEGETLQALIYAQMMHFGQIPSVRLQLDPEDIIGMQDAYNLHESVQSIQGTAPTFLADETYAMNHPISATKIQRRNVVPSLAMLLGLEPFPQATVTSFARAPLERLIRRAILSSMDPADNSEILYAEKQGNVVVHPNLMAAADGRRLANVVANAKLEMVPELGRGMGHMYRHRKLDYVKKRFTRRRGQQLGPSEPVVQEFNA